MFATTALLLVSVTVSTAGAERVKCHMVPLQTNGGLVGMCCVLVKNMSSTEVRKDLQDSGAVHFPDEKNDNKITMPDSKDGDVVFPGSKHGEDGKNSTSASKTEAKRKSDNSTMIYFPSSEHKNATSDQNSTVSLENRNKNDTPETCTDGKKKDLDGNCVDPF